MYKVGRITRVIFNNKANGYTVAIFETGDERMTITGCFHTVSSDMKYRLEGDYKVHKTYGEQFNVTSYEELMPDDMDGIRAFLASGAIKGVGPKTAKLIVDIFGDKTLDVIENEPEKLLMVKGVGAKLMPQIVDSYNEHREFARISLELAEYGIEMNQAIKIYNLYGAESVDVIKNNPYCLIEDVYGITFRRADEIAMRIGIEENSDYRIQSGIKYCLSEFAGSGSTYVPREILTERTISLLDAATEQIELNYQQMAFSGDIQTDVVDGVPVIYLYNYYLAEERVAYNIARLMDSDIVPLPANVDNLINDSEASAGILLSDEQKRAVRTALTEKTCIVTGGPGTGKTTIINAIVHAYLAMDKKIALAAPTGRAANRITETSGQPAMTIHRLLEYVFNEDTDYMEFGRNEEEPLDEEVIIIDEASMVDLMLMDGLLEAIKSGSRLIIVGDADQLPSVGAGNVLRDMIRSEYIPTIRLKEIFRQAEESRIIVNAHMINAGEYPESGGSDDDFFIMHKESEEDILASIEELVSGRLAAHYDFIYSDSDIQVLTPTRKGVLGTVNLNAVLQNDLNPPADDKAEKKFGSRIFRTGDKVMQIRNNYRTEWTDDDFNTGHGIFNGDMGRIEAVDNENDRVIVRFDDKRVVYEGLELEELELAYAVTVHKSQGSEFPAVVMPMASFPPMLMTRNLLYTGVTRGKSLVVIVGREHKLRSMVDNNRIDERYTGLDARLRKRDFGGIGGAI